MLDNLDVVAYEVGHLIGFRDAWHICGIGLFALWQPVASVQWRHCASGYLPKITHELGEADSDLALPFLS